MNTAYLGVATEADRALAEMKAEFPGVGESVLQPLAKLWSMRAAHRRACSRCADLLPECEIEAVYSLHLANALEIIAKRPDLAP